MPRYLNGEGRLMEISDETVDSLTTNERQELMDSNSAEGIAFRRIIASRHYNLERMIAEEQAQFQVVAEMSNVFV